MKVDIHAHYVPRESLKVAQEIGKGYGIKITQDENGHELILRDGKRGFGPFRDEFHDLDLRLKIMDRATIDIQALSAQNFGADHLLLGSDYPLAMGDPEPWDTVNKLKVAIKEREKISGGNAATLLGIGI